MKNVRLKAILLSIVFALCVFLVPSLNVKADSFPSEFYVNSNVYFSAEELYVAFVNLNDQQEQIACYLLGMYNLFYLGARGFSFKQGAYSDESTFIAKIKSFGYRFLQGAAEIALKSRMDTEFCKYASAVILYASQCNTDFSTWFDSIDDTFVLPVDQGIINSFTLLYNDNSAEFISEFGDTTSPWESGILHSFELGGYSWYNSSSETEYLDFINTYYPVLYSKTETTNTGLQQAVVGFKNVDYTNSVYILRNSVYSSYAFGYVDDQFQLHKRTSDLYFPCKLIRYQNSDHKLHVAGGDTTGVLKGGNHTTSSTYNDLSDFIQEVFDTAIFVQTNGWGTSMYVGAYPLIYHVFLVDNLDTLSNPQEIFNTTSFDIIGLDGNMIQPIDTVDFSPKVITTINLPDNSQSDVLITDIIQPDPAEWITTIVQPNNTNPDSVDVNLFSQATVYLDYLWNSTKKLVSYCADLLNCFEYTDENGSLYGPKMAIYGVITLGLAGGMVAKFLL